jgi:hypothetical protein
MEENRKTYLVCQNGRCTERYDFENYTPLDNGIKCEKCKEGYIVSPSGKVTLSGVPHPMPTGKPRKKDIEKVHEVTKEEIFKKMMDHQNDIGEDILDGRLDIHPLTFMTWCLGRKYINKEKYNVWSRHYIEDDLEATDSNYYVYDAEDTSGTPYAVVYSKEWNEEDYHKAMMYLAEFISESEVYQKRLDDLINPPEDDDDDDYQEHNV